MSDQSLENREGFENDDNPDLSQGNKLLKLVEVNSLTTLATYTLEEREQAWQQVVEYEKMGLEVKLVAPSIMEELAHSLIGDSDKLQEFLASARAEVEEHEGAAPAGQEQ